jgi:CBS domain containing-hemolysin-like protein
VSGPEHIIGILYAKDVMRWARLRLSSGAQQMSSARLTDMKISQIMHDALVVPETKPLSELLEEFKQRKRHMSIVVDEFGSTVGLITVEDILEQLVGEIEDEFDIVQAGSELPIVGKVMVLDGTISLRDLESQYELELPRDSGFETLAGFALSKLQKIPAVGDSFIYEGRQFTVEEMDARRISRVKIETLQPAVA